MNLRNLIVGAGALVVAAAISYVVYDRFSTRPAGSDSVIATKAPAVKREPTKLVTIKAPVKAYQGKTKAQLKLPAAVQADGHQQVIAASQVKAGLRPQTVSTVADTETGAVSTYVKTDPYPWFAVETRGEARVAYGYKFTPAAHALAPVVRLQVGYDVVRIKALTAGVLATLDTDGAGFVGVGMAYRW